MLCPQKPTWSHDFLRDGAPCPYCTGTEESTSDSVPTVTVATTELPPPSLVAPATSVGSTSAIHTTVKSVNAFRTQKISNLRTTAMLIQYRFDIRVAHAVFTPGNPIAKFTCFPESYKHNIYHNQVYNYGSLLRQFERAGLKVSDDLSHWKPILNPKGPGKWQMATNHLTKASSVPQLFTSLSKDGDTRI